MKVKLIIISIILLLVMVFACGCIPVMENIGMVSPTNEEQLSPEKGGSSDGLVKVLIGFKEKPGPAQQAMVKGLGGKIKYTYNIIPVIAASVPEVAIEALKKNPNITNVEFDSIVYALDTELDNSWGVKRIGAGFVHESGNKGKGVEIAIIDTGIDYAHPDLDANYKGGWDFVNNDSDPIDDHGHGTHVAGIIAAEDDNIDIGVVGVAPEASLYALKVLDSNGSGYVSDVVAAIQWATDPNVDGDKSDRMDIINMSLGGGANIWLEGACLLAYYEGLLLVAAAGNSGNPPGRGDNVIYPAAYDSVIAVAATDQSDERARWSSTGPDVELAAPGVSIYSTYIGGYATYSGTSMAAPHVAGTAALVIASGISDTIGVRTKLQETADDLGASGRDSLYGYGLVNAAEAVGVTGEEPPPPVTGSMHVESIVMSLETKTRGKNTFVNAIASVTIVDESDDPVVVEGATVYGHWSDTNSDSDSGITDSSGTVSLKSNKVKNPTSGVTTFTFTIDNVEKAGWTYDSTKNVVTSDSITVP